MPIYMPNTNLGEIMKQVDVAGMEWNLHCYLALLEKSG